jgi:hypothetical protein
MLRRWDRFARFIDEGRICLTNNAAERALRGFALGRKSWIFAGSERGADRAVVMATLIMTAKLNDIDPQAWLADALARIADVPQAQLHELLPWEWKCAAQIPLRLPDHYRDQTDQRPPCELGVAMESRTRTGQNSSRMNVIAGWPVRPPFRRPQCRRE